jgi:hypothetical protein
MPIKEIKPTRKGNSLTQKIARRVAHESIMNQEEVTLLTYTYNLFPFP